ncbi:MAG: GIY-YIG nuclease family protein [Variovorax sp.]|nr:GIY-YIG nuclease family protein [Variovorax sp.]
MAQQTRAGHCYVISNEGSFGSDVLKIGMTRRLEPLDRVRELGDASVPFEFDVHALIYSEDAPSLERILHREFNAQRVNMVNPRKEFFRVGLAAVKKKLKETGLEADFTMTAAAREFRETQALLAGSFEQRKVVLDAVLAAEAHIDDDEAATQHHETGSSTTLSGN